MNSYIGIGISGKMKIRGFNGEKKRVKFNDWSLLEVALKDFVVNQSCESIN